MQNQNTIVMLVLVCAARQVFSCEPCMCLMDNNYYGLQVANCRSAGFTSIPSTDIVPDNTQVLSIYGTGSIITTLHEDQFVSFQKLQEISISDCEVIKVDKNAFRNMTNMTRISLHSNLISELPVGVFSHTPHLVVLAFYRNKLKSIPEGLFSNLIHLKIVLLGYNQITSIEANSFVNVPRLEEVSLNNNELTTVNLNIFDGSSSLEKLILSSNPWHCDESLCGVMAAAVSRGLAGSFTSCATPESLQGKKWYELKEHALLKQCPPSSTCHLGGLSVLGCNVTEPATE